MRAGRKDRMYKKDDKVMVWWMGDCAYGRIIEVCKGHCYKVRLADGEICFRSEDDIIEKA